MKIENILLTFFVLTFIIGILVDFLVALYLTLWLFLYIKFIQLRYENKL